MVAFATGPNGNRMTHAMYNSNVDAMMRTYLDGGGTFDEKNAREFTEWLANAQASAEMPKFLKDSIARLSPAQREAFEKAAAGARLWSKGEVDPVFWTTGLDGKWGWNRGQPGESWLVL